MTSSSSAGRASKALSDRREGPGGKSRRPRSAQMSLAFKDVELRVPGETPHVYPTSIELEASGFNILLGPTLAGKTTLLRLMAGLLQPSAGRISFKGGDVTGVPVRDRRVAMVYQQFLNYPHLSVFENIASPLRVERVPGAQVKSRVGRIAELLRLSSLLDRRPSELSGGQQQRTALARALVKDADLVLLDEPLANLDYKLREGLRDELPRLFADRDCTVVYATTEISGSQRVVHFDLHGRTWVSQSHGVHRFDVGEIAGFRLEVASGLYFAPDGRCVSAGGA